MSEEKVEETTAKEAPAEEIEDPKAIAELNAKYRRENKALRDRMKETEAQLEQMREAQMSEQEKVISEARKQAAEEVEGHYKGLLAQERVRTAAANILNDPEDAIRFLDPGTYDVNDAESISAALAALVEAKPYLARTDGPAPRVPSIDQGPQGEQPPQASGNEWLHSVTGRGR